MTGSSWEVIGSVPADATTENRRALGARGALAGQVSSGLPNTHPGHMGHVPRLAQHRRCLQQEAWPPGEGGTG